MADRPFNVRLSVVNAEAAAAALRKFGGEGEKALRQIEAQLERQKRAGADANPFANLERGLDQFARKASTFAGIASGAVVGGLAAIAKGAFDAAGNLVDIADSTGVTVEALQELRRVAGQAGVGTEALDKALATLARRVAEAAQGTGEGKKVFDQYGIAVKNLDGTIRPVEAVLNDVAEAMRRSGDATEQNRIATALFERSGRLLVPVLKDGAAGLAAMRSEARALGGIMGDDLARKADAAGDRLQVLGQAVRGAFQIGLLREFVGPLDEVTSKLKDQQVVEGAERIGAAVGDLIRLMAENQDVIVRIGGALAGLSVGARFGPKGAIAGGLAGIFTPEILDLIKGTQLSLAQINAEMDKLQGRKANEVLTKEEVARIDDRLAQLTALQGALIEGEDAAKRAGKAVKDVGAGPVEVPQGIKDILRELEQLQQRSSALELGGLGAFKDLKQQHEDLNEIAELTAKLQNDYNLSLEKANELAANLVGLRRSEKLAIEKAEDAQKHKNAADEAQARATKKAEEDQQRRAERAQRELDRMAEHSADRVVDFGGDALDTILKRGKNTWSELWDSFVDFARRSFAQVAAEAIVRPIIQPVVQNVIGGVIGGGTGQGTLTGGTGGGGLFDLFGLAQQGNSLAGNGNGGLLNFGGLARGIDDFGTSIGFGIGSNAGSASTIAADLGFGASFEGIGAAGGASNVGSLTASSLSGTLGGIGIGLTAGSLLGNIGGKKGGNTGAAVGTALGAVVGSIFPGIGTFLGAAAGGALGGLLGGFMGGGGIQHKGGDVDITARPGRGPFIFNNAGNTDISNLAAAANESMAAITGIVGQLGGTVDFLVQSGFSNNNGDVRGKIYNIMGGSEWKYFEPTSGALTLETLRETARNAMLPSPVWSWEGPAAANPFPGVTPEVLSAMAKSPAKTLDEFLSDLQFAKTLSDPDLLNQAKLTQAEQALKEINSQFDQMAERAQTLGIGLDKLEGARQRAIAGLTSGFEQAIELQLRAIFDPFTGQMDALAKAQADRLAEAKKLGADLVNVERLSAAERKAALSGGLGGLDQLLAQIEFGQLGGASPSRQLAATRSAFEAEAAAALAGGGSPNFTVLASNLLQQSRGLNASGPRFQADLAMVRQLAELLRAGGAGGAEAIALFEQIARQLEATDATHGRLLRELSERLDVIGTTLPEILSFIAREKARA